MSFMFRLKDNTTNNANAFKGRRKRVFFYISLSFDSVDLLQHEPTLILLER